MDAERKFLHDISSPLTSLQLDIESVSMILEDRKPEEIDECIKMLGACLNQVKRAAELIRQRREILIKETAK